MGNQGANLGGGGRKAAPNPPQPPPNPKGAGGRGDLHLCWRERRGSSPPPGGGGIQQRPGRCFSGICFDLTSQRSWINPPPRLPPADATVWALPDSITTQTQPLNPFPRSCEKPKYRSPPRPQSIREGDPRRSKHRDRRDGAGGGDTHDPRLGSRRTDTGVSVKAPRQRKVQVPGELPSGAGRAAATPPPWEPLKSRNQGGRLAFGSLFSPKAVRQIFKQELKQHGKEEKKKKKPPSPLPVLTGLGEVGGTLHHRPATEFVVFPPPKPSPYHQKQSASSTAAWATLAWRGNGLRERRGGGRR